MLLTCALRNTVTWCGPYFPTDIVGRLETRQVTLTTATLATQSTTGNLGEIRVVNVLLEVEKSAIDARVWFETEYGMGHVIFRLGVMVKARLGGARGQTALLRLLAINEGSYGIEECAVSDEPSIIANVQSLIELHNVRNAEWKELCASAPPLNTVLRLTARGADICDSSRGIKRVILVLIDGRRTLMQVLEESSFDPVEALKIVTRALADNLVQIVPKVSSLFPPAQDGDASGVLPRTDPPPPASVLEPVRPITTSGPPSWRRGTLIGVGYTKPEPKPSGGGLAPARIIDIDKSVQTQQTERQVPAAVGVSSFVKTVVPGFGSGTSGATSDAAPINRSEGLQHRIVAVADTKGVPPPLPQSQSSWPPNQEDSQREPIVTTNEGGKRYIDRYELLLRIGRGGMGTVYLCRLSSAHVGFKRLFALKLLRNHLSQDTQAAKDFLTEAQVAGQLHHANVVAVYDAGFHGKQPYLVMDYVEGCSFKQLMRGMPNRAPSSVLPIIIDVLAGLHAAHTLQDESGAPLKLVHCDVSPENLLVGVDGICRLADFGIARKASRMFGATTRGKPSYVAPEQITGHSFDHRADIFSAGVVLWGALTGSRLFAGETADETISQVCHKRIEPPSACGANSYPALDNIVMCALARNPADRFETAEEMLSELRRAALSHDGLATPKEIAAWVREAAGGELTQRRLAILDASRNNPTIPPPEGPAAEDFVDATAYDMTHAVMTSDILSSERVATGLTPEILTSSRHFVDSDQPPNPAQPSEAASGPPSLGSAEVAALFYGQEELLRGTSRTSSTPALKAVSHSKNKSARLTLAKAKRRVLWAAIAVAVVLVLALLVFRTKPQVRVSHLAISSLKESQLSTASRREGSAISDNSAKLGV